MSFFKFVKYFEFETASIVLFVIRVERKSSYVSIYDLDDDKNLVRPRSFILIHFAKRRILMLFDVF